MPCFGFCLQIFYLVLILSFPPSSHLLPLVVLLVPFFVPLLLVPVLFTCCPMYSKLLSIPFYSFLPLAFWTLHGDGILGSWLVGMVRFEGNITSEEELCLHVLKFFFVAYSTGPKKRWRQ